MTDLYSHTDPEPSPPSNRLSVAPAMVEITSSPMRIAVVVPTYARPDALRRCLAGLSSQARRPDDVLIVVRVDDRATCVALHDWEDWLPIRVVEVSEPGLVYALNAGTAATDADVVAYTDDDAVPRPDWLARIEMTYADTQVGGVGGRDVISDHACVAESQTEAFAARLKLGGRKDPVVGRVQSFGRIIGNHDRGTGPPRDVDALKGVNMSYRRALMLTPGFDDRIRGTGSQVHNELSVCLPLRAAGWRIVYDPAIAVDHHQAPRPHEDDRDLRDARRVYESTFNETLSLWPYLHVLWRPAYAAWAVVFGTIWSPGFAQIPRHLRRGNRRAVGLVLAALRARRDAVIVLSTTPPRRTAPTPGQFAKRMRTGI